MSVRNAQSRPEERKAASVEAIVASTRRSFSATWPTRARGFVPQPKRSVVEQTYGTLALHRRLVRDYEHRPISAETRVHWAMTDVMTRD